MAKKKSKKEVCTHTACKNASICGLYDKLAPINNRTKLINYNKCIQNLYSDLLLGRFSSYNPKVTIPDW